MFIYILQYKSATQRKLNFYSSAGYHKKTIEKQALNNNVGIFPFWDSGKTAILLRFEN